MRGNPSGSVVPLALYLALYQVNTEQARRFTNPRRVSPRLIQVRNMDAGETGRDDAGMIGIAIDSHQRRRSGMS